MGRYTGQIPQQAVVTSVTVPPLGGAASVFRSGDAYKAVGELVQRSQYPDLSAAFPRNGSVSSVAITTGGGGSTTYVGCVFATGKFVAITPTGQCYTSTDGRNWIVGTSLPSITSRNYVGLSYGAGLFVAIAGGGSGNTSSYATSPDGVTWTLRTSMASASWTAIGFGNGLFVALSTVASTGSTVAASSTDGLTWTPRTMPTSSNWTSITYGGGVWLATSSSTDAATSANGTTWTARTLPLIPTGYPTYAAGLFVVGSTQSTLATSPDGIAWTVRVLSGVSNQFQSFAYGDGVFVGFLWNVALAYVSYDGVSWLQKSLVSGIPGAISAYAAGVFVGLPYSGVASNGLAVFAENLTNSDYLYLSGTPGQLLRVK